MNRGSCCLHRGICPAGSSAVTQGWWRSACLLFRLYQISMNSNSSVLICCFEINLLSQIISTFKVLKKFSATALSQQLPVVAGYYVDNQKEVYAEYAANNLIYPLGNLLNLDFAEMNYSLIVEKINSLHTMDFSLVSLRYRRLFQNMFVPIEIKKNGQLLYGLVVKTHQKQLNF